MVALSLTTNELRKMYRKRYQNKKTLLNRKIIPPNLLFTTTTSAYGKSSIYDRLKFHEQQVSKFLGFTTGAGTFHISEKLYNETLLFLKRKNIDTKRGYGTGPSRKLKLIRKAFQELKIPNLIYHNIKRGVYIFPNVSNLQNVTQLNSRPKWYDRPFDEIQRFWLERWCIPRSQRSGDWKNFNSLKFIDNVKKILSQN